MIDLDAARELAASGDDIADGNWETPYDAWAINPKTMPSGIVMYPPIGGNQT